MSIRISGHQNVLMSYSAPVIPRIKLIIIILSDMVVLILPDEAEILSATNTVLRGTSVVSGTAKVFA